MPQVPVYGDQRVREAPLPTPYGSAPSGAGMDALALARAGSEGLKIADQVMLRQDQLKAFETEAAITTEWTQWDAENRPKFQGKNVEGYAPAAQKWWDDARQRAGKDLNGRARQFVDVSLAQKRGAATASVLQWSGQERERHFDATAAALLDSTAQFGVSTGQTDLAAKQIRDQVIGIGERKGWDADQVSEATVKALSKMHVSQIDRLVDENAEAAKAYYTAHQAEIDKDQQSKIEDVIKAEDDKQWAAGFAEKHQGLPYDQQIAKAEAIKDTDRRQAALTQVDAKYSRKQRVIAETERVAADQAYRLFNSNERVPEQLFQAMDPLRANSLRNAIDARDKSAGALPTHSDPDVLTKFMFATPEQLKTITPEQYAAEFKYLLDPTDFAKYGNMIADLRRGGDVAAGAITTKDRISNAVLQAGLNVTYLDTDDKGEKQAMAEARGRLVRDIDTRIAAARAEKKGKGAELSGEEEQKIIDEVVLNKVALPRTSWGTKHTAVPRSILTPEEERTAYIQVGERRFSLAEVPSEDRIAIEAGMRGVGEPVTEEGVLRHYLVANGIPLEKPSDQGHGALSRLGQQGGPF